MSLKKFIPIEAEDLPIVLLESSKGKWSDPSSCIAIFGPEKLVWLLETNERPTSDGLVYIMDVMTALEPFTKRLLDLGKDKLKQAKDLIDLGPASLNGQHLRKEHLHPRIENLTLAILTTPGGHLRFRSPER